MVDRILVVDDDLDSLKLIGLMLQRSGYEVSAANTGGQALAKAVAERPDLIILDVMMPDMNGYEVCRRLRTNIETKLIPIIMFTAKTLIDDKVAGFEAGADDYLTKPTHPSELASRVRTILSRNSQKKADVNLGTTIGVLGAKGGLGTSTLALNLAAARVLAGENAIVADFRLGEGTIALALGQSQTHGMASLLSKTSAEIKPRVVEAELVSHSSGLRALLASTRPREAQMHYGSDMAVAVLRTLRHLGRPIVVDLGSGYSSQFSNLAPELDQLLIVIDSNPITLTIARDLIREIESGHESGRLHLVAINRTTTPGQVWQDIERYLGSPVRAVLSPGIDLILQAHHSSVPAIMFQPAAMYSTQVSKLAEEIMARQSQAARLEPT